MEQVFSLHFLIHKREVLLVFCSFAFLFWAPLAVSYSSKVLKLNLSPERYSVWIAVKSKNECERKKFDIFLWHIALLFATILLFNWKCNGLTFVEETFPHFCSHKHLGIIAWNKNELNVLNVDNTVCHHYPPLSVLSCLRLCWDCIAIKVENIWCCEKPQRSFSVLFYT